MKRHSGEPHGSAEKRQKSSAEAQTRPHRQWKQGPNRSYGNGFIDDFKGNMRKQGNGQSQPAAQITSLAAADPLQSLEQLLKGLTAHPAAVEEHLGPSAIDHANGLLKALSTRKRTAKTTFDILQPATLPQGPISAYHAPTPLSASSLPPLPPIPPGPYTNAPFTHKSSTQHDRVTATNDLTYERLEFLGDAYLETLATRLIFSRYNHLPAGRQAQMRETLVKNETLLAFSTAYNFPARLQASAQDLAGSLERGNKGTGKILADVFEAYVGALVLADPEHGFATAEAWLTALWAPILLDKFGPQSALALAAEYNPRARDELQKRVMSKDVGLEYLAERPVLQLDKATQRFFLGVYLTGQGWVKKLLGKGEGLNKVEAANRAAMDALENQKDLIDEVERRNAVAKEARRAAKAVERDAAEEAPLDGSRLVDQAETKIE